MMKSGFTLRILGEVPLEVHVSWQPTDGKSNTAIELRLDAKA